jgi:glycosyltransferase involved in cell wall biosynthesis
LKKLSAPICSIITVVYNNPVELESTINSVLEQNYLDYEFIIIDGGSSEPTKNIIEKYKDNIDYWVSEPDRGIYDAMNKGIIASKGRWLNFMNAGDVYVDQNVLSDVFKENENNENYNSSSFLIGNTVVDYGGFKRNFVGNIANISLGTQFVHQSVFISKEFNTRYPYDITQKIAADYQFFYKALYNNEPYWELNKDICLFAAGGISDTERIRSLIGGLKISLSIKFSLKALIIYSFNILKAVTMLIIKSILPLIFIKKIRIFIVNFSSNDKF